MIVIIQDVYFDFGPKILICEFRQLGKKEKPKYFSIVQFIVSYKTNLNNLRIGL